MDTVLNLESLRNAPLKTDPFPYFTVNESIRMQDVQAIVEDFPKIPGSGSYNLDNVEIGAQFDRLLQSVDTLEFRKILCDKFDVKIMDLPMMITLRGHSHARDGRIHTDSKTKVLTILIYLNRQWTAASGRLRILRNGNDIGDYIEEVTPGPGSLLAFKVTDNGWHGYLPFEGRRQAVQINFLTSRAANSKHRFFHSLSAKLKRILPGEIFCKSPGPIGPSITVTDADQYHASPTKTKTLA